GKKSMIKTMMANTPRNLLKRALCFEVNDLLKDVYPSSVTFLFNWL
ncbi:MAG: hypothetical protein ACI917_001150, partial [Patiriisocius sp.]